MKRLLPLVLVLAACGGQTRSSCATVQNGVLPTWARTGFSDKEPRVAHVMGAHGTITAILFNPKLSAGEGNKILWVSKFPQSGVEDLHITARSGGRTVTRVVSGGPGPSTIELPSAGCWQVSLRWGSHADSLSLTYV